jgi:anaerobic selenocysteine-containing dehydrogenase
MCSSPKTLSITITSTGTRGSEQLAARARGTTSARRRDNGLPAESIDRLRATTATAGGDPPNYGMQRHAGGGMAMRTAACLPALVGAWRDPAGGALLSSSGTYPVNSKGLERPDLSWNQPRTINMSAIGDALLDVRDPPVRAIFVYNSNPVAVAPESTKVVRGFSRDDLFCVVHDVFLTDSADYADIVLPATTQLEHVDVHSSYGHLYVLANNRAIEPLGEAKPNTELFRLLAARMGYTEPCFPKATDRAQCLSHRPPARRRLDWDVLKANGWQRLNVPSPFAPFAQGGFPTPSGKCEFYSASLARQGLDPLPTFTPPRESAASNPDLAQRYPLALLTPPARNALKSTFANARFPAVGKDAGSTCIRTMPACAGLAMATRCAPSTIAAVWC